MDQIENMGSDSMWENYTRAKWYKMIHLAKNKGYLLSLKKDLFFVPSLEMALAHQTEEEMENAVIENRYRHILHEHIKKYMDNKWLITGTTALNIFLQNYEIPDTITLISVNKQSVETIVRDKKVAVKKVTLGTTSFFNVLKKNARKVTVRNKSFYTTSLSVSLLEALYANTDNELLTVELCKKIIRKYRKQLDRTEIIALLRKGKYHSSMNKLYKIARSIDESYAQQIMDIIKKHSYRISV